MLILLGHLLFFQVKCGQSSVNVNSWGGLGLVLVVNCEGRFRFLEGKHRIEQRLELGETVRFNKETARHITVSVTREARAAGTVAVPRPARPGASWGRRSRVLQTCDEACAERWKGLLETCKCGRKSFFVHEDLS